MDTCRYSEVASHDEEPRRLYGCSDEAEWETISIPSTEESDEPDGMCQKCLTLCQADCCQLVERYRSWSSPTVVEGVMFFLFFTHGFLEPVTLQFIYQRIWQIAITDNSTTPRDLDVAFFIRDSFQYSCAFLYGNGTLPYDDLALKVLHDTADWENMFGLVSDLIPVFTSLYIVSYSDVFGRRFGLAVPIVGNIISIIAFLVLSSNETSLHYVIVASVISGIFGNIASASGVAYAYIADVVPSSARTFRFSVFSCIRYVALGLATMLSSFVVKYFNFAGAFSLMFILNIFCLLYVIFILPESCKLGKQRSFVDFNPIALFISPFLALSVFTKNRSNPRDRIILIIMLVMNFFESAIYFGGFYVLSEYLVAPPYCFSPGRVAIIETLVLVLDIVGPFICVYLLAKKLPDAGIGAFTALLNAVGIAVQALSFNLGLLILGILLQIFLPIPSGISRSIMSKIVGPEEQGALQAGVTSVRALGGTVSALLCIKVFKVTVDSFSGAVFVLLASLGILVLLCFVVTGGLQKDTDEDYSFDVRSIRRMAIQRYREIYGRLGVKKQGSKDSLMNNEDYDSDDVFGQ